VLATSIGLGSLSYVESDLANSACRARTYGYLPERLSTVSDFQQEFEQRARIPDFKKVDLARASMLSIDGYAGSHSFLTSCGRLSADADQRHAV
jgi:hypothetical protein